MNPENQEQSGQEPRQEDIASTEAAAGAPPMSREAELEAQVTTLKDQLLRAMAETENTRRRLEQDAEGRSKYAVSSFAKEMLQVADNLRRAVEAIPANALKDDPLARSLAEGVELTERTLIAALERQGIKRVAAMGQRFDANLHQAMMEIPDSPEPAGTVVLEMQSGYTIHGRLLRPALVGVSKGNAAPRAETGIDTTA